MHRRPNAGGLSLRAAREPSSESGARALVALLACTTFSFAGVYPGSLVAPGVICAAMIAVYRPWTAALGRPFPRLEFWLALILAAAAFQLLPLPAPLIDRLSPADRHVWQSLSLTPVNGPLPISVALVSTVWACAVLAGVIAVFLISRQIFMQGGVRIVTRGIAAAGLILGAIGLAQDATAHGSMYWRWKPLGEGAPPFGPFVDRNHFATWVVLGVPLALGYLIAHATAHRQDALPGASWHRTILHALDARAIWLTAAICLMLVALIASLSRSGMLGVTAAIFIGVALRRARSNGVSAAVYWILGAVGLTAAAALLRVNTADMMGRVGGATAAFAGRVAIWRATMPVIRDFWLTGTGVGTFDTAMLVYQRTPSLFRINAAHNHYVQLAAEGGLLVCVPVAGAIFLYARAASAALAEDESGMYWIRAGALCGLCGVAVQSIWETGLTTPANAVLAAMAAAIVVHRPESRVRIAP